MKKKTVKKITKEEMNEMIAKITADYLESIGQKGGCDDVLGKTRTSDGRVKEGQLEDFIGKTFKFFGEDGLRKNVNIIFTLQRITKLNEIKTILEGDIIYNGEKISVDSIVIDSRKDKVVYKEKESGSLYNLEIDIRSKDLWESLSEYILNVTKKNEYTDFTIHKRR